MIASKYRYIEIKLTEPMFKNTLSTRRRWFDYWLESFGKELSSGIWSLEKQGATLQIPYSRKTFSVAGLPIPAALGAVNSHTPRYDVLGELSDPATDIPKMMDELGVAMLQFPYLSPASELAGKLMAGDTGLRTHVEPCETAPHIDTTGDWDEYWTGLGKSRRELGRRERKFMGREGARFTLLTDWQDIEPVFREILDIEASGWKGKEGSAIVQDESTLKFYTSLAKDWAEAGYLRLFLLYDGETCVAFELDAEYKGILHCFKHAYLDSYAKQGPGQVLRVMILRWAFENESVKVFDMFGPDSDAKRKWATGDEQLITLKVFKSSPLGFLAWLRFSLAPRLKARLTS